MRTFKRQKADTIELERKLFRVVESNRSDHWSRSFVTIFVMIKSEIESPTVSGSLT